MNFYGKVRKSFSLNIFAFFILFVLIMMYAFEKTRVFGFVALIITLLFPLFYFIRYFNKIKITKLLVIWFIYVSYGLIRLITDFTIYGVSVFLKHILLLFFVTILSQSSISNDVLYRTSKYFTNFYKSLIVLVILNELFFSTNWITQFLYKMVIMCMYFAIIKTDKVYKYSFITIIILSITSTRSAILSIFLFLIMYKWIEIVKTSKTLYKLTFLIGVFLIIIIPIIYIELQYTDIGMLINTYSRKLFKKNFFSGRQYVWEHAFLLIRNSPLLGYGFSKNILSNIGINISVHNVYLNLLLQGGIVLLVLFILFIYQIWMKFFNYLDNKIIKLSASYIFAVLMRANFDLILLQNDLVISVYLWFPLIIGLSYTNNLCGKNYTISSRTI